MLFRSYLTENGAKEIHVRLVCSLIMYGCKYLNFSRSVSDMELITRRCIRELEGLDNPKTATANPAGFDKAQQQSEIPEDVLKEYADPHTERHKNMVELIRQKMGFDSLKYQELPSLLEATGVSPCKLCTYCWDGKE